MRTIKLLAVVGLAVALVAVPALAQGQQQPTVTITVRCSSATPSRPEVDQQTVQLIRPRGDTVAWNFAANLNTCVSGVASAKITFTRTTQPITPLAAPTPPPAQWPSIVINITAGQAATAGPFTVSQQASAGNYPYKIEFFSQPNAQGTPIPNTTINGTNTVIEVTPTLTEWGLIALAVLLAGGMGYMLYRRRPALRPAAP